ncbi:MAG TPA: coagulation factor 5/8 type domain-containing protein [Solirubrobacteraceae bacterium]|nr:coagulation factor 5/8 type domain-containing protein [Solirubrobacteraceae bacterium]
MRAARGRVTPTIGSLGGRSRRVLRRALLVVSLLALAAVAGDGAAAAATHRAHDVLGDPAFGPNVVVFSPSMPQSEIQARLDQIGNQQVPNQFGSQRYAILFEPGTYGSASDPLAFQVGYYTQVAGLGASPHDVVINGSAQVNNQCASGSCTGLDNFWRSLSNLTVNFVPKSNPAFYPNGESASCQDSNAMWAVSQAAPMRRVILNAKTFLFDYCGGPQYVSGGFFGDDSFSNTVVNGGQQQFFTRNSNLDNGWSNGVWNQVFMGDNGAPAESFGPGSQQYTTRPTTPVSREQPFLYRDTTVGRLKVFVPAARQASVGPDYAAGAAPGYSLPIGRFFIADPSSPVSKINAALSRGRDLLFAPGVYQIDHTIKVNRPDTIVMGLGFATLIPRRGNVTMRTADVPGIKLSGMIFDAGAQRSPALLQVGSYRHGQGEQSNLRRAHHERSGGGHASGTANLADPTLLSDVFFRIGGAEPGQATDALVVNTGNAILDDVWAWRADHGAGAGWTTNPAATGVVVNGNNVNAYGLAVEHFQKDEVLWNGQNGRVVFFQNEMPYDPPTQAAWMSSPTNDGYPAFKLGADVTRFAGYGMGSYSFFNQGVPIYSSEAFSSPKAPGDRFHDLLTVFLNGSGGIRSVINGVGGPSNAGNAGTPQDVIRYP